MKTLQNGDLQIVYGKDGRPRWKYVERDGSVLFFKEANIVTGHDCVYRASQEMTLTVLKSTMRKHKNDPEIVVEKFPDPNKFSLTDYILSNVVGYDYNSNRQIVLTK